MSEVAVVPPPKINRREFLFYGWAASIALFSAASGGAVLWFAYPIFRAGEFGGTFNVPVAQVPGTDAAPEAHSDGRFWLVNTENGVLALYMVCVHLGCLYKWVPSNTRFECPCHGSKYQRFGDWIEGPAPRSLDRFVIEAVDDSGKVLGSTPNQSKDANVTPTDGGPLAIPAGATTLRVLTGTKVKGKNHA